VLRGGGGPGLYHPNSISNFICTHVQMAGFYRSKYTNAAGEIKHAGVTQFEATDARRAFPCWDEPAVKARFNVTLTVRGMRCCSAEVS
jgi:aminopeptidase N